MNEFGSIGLQKTENGKTEEYGSFKTVTEAMQEITNWTYNFESAGESYSPVDFTIYDKESDTVLAYIQMHIERRIYELYS